VVHASLQSPGIASQAIARYGDLDSRLGQDFVYSPEEYQAHCGLKALKERRLFAGRFFKHTQMFMTYFNKRKVRWNAVVSSLEEEIQGVTIPGTTTVLKRIDVLDAPRGKKIFSARLRYDPSTPVGSEVDALRSGDSFELEAEIESSEGSILLHELIPISVKKI
jgi:hypothetical protein